MIWTKEGIERMRPIWDAEVKNMMDWLMGKDKVENKENKEVEQSKKENNDEEANKIQ